MVSRKYITWPMKQAFPGGVTFRTRTLIEKKKLSGQRVLFETRLIIMHFQWLLHCDCDLCFHSRQCIQGKSESKVELISSNGLEVCAAQLFWMENSMNAFTEITKHFFFFFLLFVAMKHLFLHSYSEVYASFKKGILSSFNFLSREESILMIQLLLWTFLYLCLVICLNVLCGNKWSLRDPLPIRWQPEIQKYSCGRWESHSFCRNLLINQRKWCNDDDKQRNDRHRSCLSAFFPLQSKEN